MSKCQCVICGKWFDESEMIDEYCLDCYVEAPKDDPQKQKLKDFLQTELTRAEKLILVFYYYDEMTFREIAATLNLSEKRVAQMHSYIISRAKVFTDGTEGKDKFY